MKDDYMKRERARFDAMLRELDEAYAKRKKQIREAWKIVKQGHGGQRIETAAIEAPEKR